MIYHERLWAIRTKGGKWRCGDRQGRRLTHWDMIHARELAKGACWPGDKLVRVRATYEVEEARDVR